MILFQRLHAETQTQGVFRTPPKTTDKCNQAEIKVCLALTNVYAAYALLKQNTMLITYCFFSFS